MPYFGPTPELLSGQNKLWFGDTLPTDWLGGAIQASDYLWLTNSTDTSPALYRCTAASSSGITWVIAGVGQKVVVNLSAAQITTLHSVPVPLVAAPPAGQVIEVDSCFFQFKYGSVQFTGGGQVNPVYHGATVDLLSGGVAAATITAAASATVSCGSMASGLTLTSATGVDLYAATADFAAGNSTAVVTLGYRIITLG